MTSVRLLVTLTVLLFLSVGVGAAQDWSQYQKDAENTGSVEGEENQSWIYRTNVSVTSPVVRSEGSVYFGNSVGEVYAINEGTKEELWTSSISSNSIYASPVVDEGSVYFTDGGGAVHSYNTTGGENWIFETEQVTLSTPAVARNTVIVADAGSVYAVDAESGEEDWKTAVDKVIAFSPTVDESVYVGTIESRRPEDGDANGTLYSIDIGDGTVNWRISGSGVVTTPAVAESTVFFGTVGGSLVAVEKETGDEVWRLSTNTSEVSSPAYSEGTVYYGVASDELHAVDAGTGERMWSFEGSGDMTASPAVSGDVVYAGSRRGFVYAVNAATGEGLWWTDLQSRMKSIAITSSSSTVYAGTELGVAAVSANGTGATRYGESTEEDGQNGGVDLPPPGEENPIVETPSNYTNETGSNASDNPNTSERRGDERDGSTPLSTVYPLALGIVALVIVALYGWRRDLY